MDSYYMYVYFSTLSYALCLGTVSWIDQAELGLHPPTPSIRTGWTLPILLVFKMDRYSPSLV